MVPKIQERRIPDYFLTDGQKWLYYLHHPMVGHSELLRVSKLSTIRKEIGQSGHLMVPACPVDYMFIDAKHVALRAKKGRYNGFGYF